MKKRITYIILFILLFLGIDRGIGLLLNAGLERYFGLNQHSTVLLVGHSQLMLSTDKVTFEQQIGLPVSKYCREGVNVADREVMIRQFLASPYSDSLKVVLYGVDQFMFTGAGLSQNSYKLFYPFMSNRQMDTYIHTNAEDRFDYWLHKEIWTTRYSDALINSSIRGWLHNWDNYKFGQLQVEALEKDIAEDKQRHIRFDPELIAIFEQTLSELTERGIRVILVNTPIAKPLHTYEPEAYQKIETYFLELAQSPLIDYWDLNPDFSARYELFFDAVHLNDKGQKIVNQYLVDRFRTETKPQL